MENATNVPDSVTSSNVSTTESEDAYNSDSYVSGHPDWLDDYPLHLAKEIDLFRPLWENFQDMHDPLDRLGRQVLLGHEQRDELLKSHVKREKEMNKEMEGLMFAVKDARTQIWAYEVELEGMRRKIFELEATLDNLRDESINNFHLEVRIDDLKERLNKMTATNKALQVSINTFQKARKDLMKTSRGFQKELKQEQDLKTDFQDRYNELVARQGNVERWLADYKIRKMKAALDAAKAETAHWKRVSADVINGHRPTDRFPIFSANPKLIRRQSL